MRPWLRGQGFEAFGMMNRALKKAADHSCESSGGFLALESKQLNKTYERTFGLKGAVFLWLTLLYFA